MWFRGLDFGFLIPVEFCSTASGLPSTAEYLEQACYVFGCRATLNPKP